MPLPPNSPDQRQQARRLQLLWARPVAGAIHLHVALGQTSSFFGKSFLVQTHLVVSFRCSSMWLGKLVIMALWRCSFALTQLLLLLGSSVTAVPCKAICQHLQADCNSACSKWFPGTSGCSSTPCAFRWMARCEDELLWYTVAHKILWPVSHVLAAAKLDGYGVWMHVSAPS